METQRKLRTNFPFFLSFETWNALVKSQTKSLNLYPLSLTKSTLPTIVWSFIIHCQVALLWKLFYVIQVCFIIWIFDKASFQRHNKLPTLLQDRFLDILSWLLYYSFYKKLFCKFLYLDCCFVTVHKDTVFQLTFVLITKWVSAWPCLCKRH